LKHTRNIDFTKNTKNNAQQTSQLHEYFVRTRNAENLNQIGRRKNKVFIILVQVIKQFESFVQSLKMPNSMFLIFELREVTYTILSLELLSLGFGMSQRASMPS